MKDELSEKQTDSILKALDEALEKGPWDKSNFLRVIGKNLRTIRDKFANRLQGPGHEKSKITPHLANRIALRSGQQEIYISLYSSDGRNLQSWERILLNIPNQIISRPIYADEEDVKTLIRSKENQYNEGYVAIYVSQSDILPLPADKVPLDKLGKPLLTLKAKSLRLENISRFTHKTGQYQYSQGRLIKQASAE